MNLKNFFLVFLVLVIVVAVFFVILGSLEVYPPKGPDSPYKTAEYLVYEMRNVPNIPLRGVSVFAENGDSISVASIAQHNNLNPNQICLDMNDSLSSIGFQINENRDLITYNGQEKIKVNFYGICAKKENLGDFLDKPNSSFKNFGFDFYDSGCYSKCIDGEDCCVLILVKEN